MESSAEVAIIGGGVIGLSVAHSLARGGLNGVIVLERGYIGGGASTRGSSAIKTQFGTKENIILAKESRKMYEKLSRKLGFNVLFRHNGSLFLAETEEEVKMLKKNTSLQNSLGVKSKIMSPEEAQEVVPCLDPEGVLLASYNEGDADVHHDAVVWAYAQASQKLGVRIETRTEVKGFRLRRNRIETILTSEGGIKASVVVNAAGPWSAHVAKMANVELPNKPRKGEMAVIESLKHFLGPYIFCLHKRLHLKQTLRGELFGGIDNMGEVGQGTTLTFVESFAREVTRILPALKHAAVMRQWTGVSDVTPDGCPILGRTDEVNNFIQSNGFAEYGFTLAPIVGKLMAELIIDGETSIPIKSYSLRRFKENKMLIENTTLVNRRLGHVNHKGP